MSNTNDSTFKEGDVVEVIDTSGNNEIRSFFEAHSSGTFTIKYIDYEGRIHLKEDERGRFCFFPRRFKKANCSAFEVNETDLEELLNG